MMICANNTNCIEKHGANLYTFISVHTAESVWRMIKKKSYLTVTSLPEETIFTNALEIIVSSFSTLSIVLAGLLWTNRQICRKKELCHT